MISNKNCNQCLIEKSLSDFSKDKYRPDGYRSICKMCRRQEANASVQKWRKAHPEKAKAAVKKWADLNSDYMKLYQKRYRKENYPRVLERLKEWRLKNPSKGVADEAQRRASKRQATPKWANKFFIAQAYDLARTRKTIVGGNWHVDHIVPLQSKIVCGLHVENNLQVIPAKENWKKHNHYWPDMP